MMKRMTKKRREGKEKLMRKRRMVRRKTII
jgi:hypothetical protein